MAFGKFKLRRKKRTIDMKGSQVVEMTRGVENDTYNEY